MAVGGEDRSSRPIDASRRRGSVASGSVSASTSASSFAVAPLPRGPASDHEAAQPDEQVTTLVDQVEQTFAIPAMLLAPETAKHAVLEELHPGLDDGHNDGREPLSETSPLLRRDEEAATATLAAAEATASTVTFLSETNPRRFWICFSLLLINIFVTSFDGTVMATSYPVITSDFKRANSATWLSTAFLLTSTTTQPFMGRLSDAVGRKPLFLGSSLIFLISLVWCALAPTFGSFIAARALSGIGCGGATIVGAILTSDMVPLAHRGTYQSLFNVVFGSGGALGAALGGWMAETLGWRWEFGVQVPFVFVNTCIGAVALPRDIGLHHEPTLKHVWQALKDFDIVGSILLTVSLASLILGINIGGNNLPWSHPFVIAMLAVFVATFPVFIFSQMKAAKPLMPLGPLHTRPRANMIFTGFLTGFLYNSVLFNMPLYFQAVLLANATSSGLRLIVPTIATATTGALVGRLITRTRRLKWPLSYGAVIALVGSIILSFIRSDLPQGVYIVGMIPSAIGNGCLYAGTFIGLLATSPHAEQAVITSTLVLWRSLGLVLGVAYSGLVVQNGLRYYLGLYIDDGPGKAEIIDQVRKSVELVAKLEEPLRSQVTAGYGASIRLSFIICTLFAVIIAALLLPIRLPRLPERK